MSRGKNSSSQIRERRYPLLHLSEVNEETAKGERHQNSQSLLSMALKYVYAVYRHIPNTILKEIASYAFYLVIFQSRFCVKFKDFRRNNLVMGKFVEALILIIRDNTRVLSTKAQLF